MLLIITLKKLLLFILFINCTLLYFFLNKKQNIFNVSFYSFSKKKRQKLLQIPIEKFRTLEKIKKGRSNVYCGQVSRKGS